MLITLIAVVGFYILDKTLVSFLKACYRCICCIRGDRDDDLNLVHPGFQGTKNS